MQITVFSLIAIAAYTLGSLYQIPALLRSRATNTRALKSLITIGALSQTLSIYFALHTGDGINLSIFNVASLISWIIMLVVLLSSLRKPVESLFSVMAPIAALCVLLASLNQNTSNLLPDTAGEAILHILLSIGAYSLLMIATCQALLLTYQEYRLRKHKLKGLSRILPPLQTVEALLFEFVWSGVILLTLALVSGFFYLDNMFAQHLVHKTILSVIAWLIFSTLLWGHHIKGWRGNIASRWTLVGSTVLVLSYFGSRFMLDIVLH